MADMQRLRRWMRSSAGLSLILLYCLGCAAGPAGTGSKAEAPETMLQKEASKPTSPAGLRVHTDRILSVTVQEGTKDIIVRMTGNAPFQDYQFRRLQDDRFSLELSDVHSKADLPALPPPSDQLKLSFEDEKAPNQGVQLLGTLNKPLDHYILDTAGNDLVLALYPSRQSRSLPVETTPPPPPSKKEKPRGTPAQAQSSPAPQPTAGVRGVVSEPREVLDAEETTGAAMLKKRYAGKPISLDLLDADLRNVLRLLADVTGTNIVIEPDVSGRVTLKVEHVPWDQVLDMVLAMNGLGKEQVGNVVRIAKQTKLQAEYTQQADEIKAKQALFEAAKDLGEITTAYLTVNYAAPADIAAKITEIKSDKGKISIDERTSLILYSDYPVRLENAKKLIARLDKATSQVLIEARIVQLSTLATRDLGIRWDLNSSNTNPAADFHVTHPVAGDLFHFNYGQVIGKALWTIDLTLSALETASKGKVLSSPRVLTVNNVKAIISQGTQIPYLSASQAVPGGTAQGDIATTEFRSAVLELQVTPHITPDRKVRMEIQAKQDRPSGGTVQGQPILDTRSITTELLVEDGNTVVIGGVIEDNEAISSGGTPGLNKIPLLGWLFKDNTIRKEKTEMLIFICPRIVDATTLTHGG